MTKARRIAAAFVVALVLSFALALHPLQAQQSDRGKQVGKRFMCLCGGCTDTATTCYHTGGAFSGPCDMAKGMQKKIEQQIAHGDSDDLIVQSFVQEFGTRVYAEPPKSGLSLVAWMMPSVYLLLGTALVVFIIWRWHARGITQATMPTRPSGFSSEDLERARRRVNEETQD